VETTRTAGFIIVVSIIAFCLTLAAEIAHFSLLLVALFIPELA